MSNCCCCCNGKQIPPDQFIEIPFEDIFYAIHMRTWYKGENVKRKDMDADLTQTSRDDNEELSMFATTAANRVAAIIYTKIPNVNLIITPEEIYYTFADVIKRNTKPMIRKAIFDYIVNWCLYMWYHTTYPELAQSYLDMMQIYEDELKKTSNMLQKIIRRRYVLY